MKEQIEQLKNDITECYGCDPMYYGTDVDFLAKELVEMGWRKQEWISIDDRLPDTDEVLVYYRKGVGHAAPKTQGLDKMDWDVFFNITGTTHWMPLPQPPKMKGGAE